MSGSIVESSGSQGLPDVDETDGFREPAGRVRQRKKILMNSTAVNTTSVKNSEGKDICRFFRKGHCKYGFLGKFPRDGRQECPFSHPKPCSKLLDYGTDSTSSKGCGNRRKCGDMHPKMCKESMENKTCSRMKDGGRCDQGYHVRGTKATRTSKPPPTKPSKEVRSAKDQASKESVPTNIQPKSTVRGNTPTTTSPVCGKSTNEEENRNILASFLGEILWEEVNKIRNEIREIGGQSLQDPRQNSGQGQAT
jgi:hypothetical protein